MEINNNKKFEEVSFKSFLTNYRIVIPMVQRDYAQGRKTDDVNRIRNRFLDAIKSYLTKSPDNTDKMKLDFVYGEKELVWDKNIPGKLDSIIITPLDGQQRLTTLYLLYWYASRSVDISKEDYSFLNNFTYDIRPSSRDFCSRLLDFTPIESIDISTQIIDQYWFQGEWHHDPTIESMLVMLDSIKTKFSDIKNLWKVLTGENQRIFFYFLPLSENGLSDELYIKMNSRGKKLTMFEHFKAEYEDLYERDSDEARIVNHKFDVEWSDTLFDYRDSDNTIDKEWMRYFFYISHILCYLQSIPKSNDEFELIDKLYKNNKNADKNKEFLEKAFDCWHEVKKEYTNIDMFFQTYLTCSIYEEGKLTTFKRIYEYRDSQNFFNACIKLYQVNNNFAYSDFLFLYGIITYLMNKNNIEKNEFIERLRVLRNLILNSDSGEIRSDADYMKDLLTETEILITTGEIVKAKNHGYNGNQEEEELKKQIAKKSLCKEEISLINKFEDHPLIYGYISEFGYGVDSLSLVNTFCEVFNDSADYNLIHRAMISLDDYTQHDNNRYYMGNGNRSTWAKLMHPKTRKGYKENTIPVLKNLLFLIQEGRNLSNVINDFLNESEHQHLYSWRYYFAKYNEMLRGADGELTCDDSSDYIWITLNKHQFNGKHWYSFHNVIYSHVKVSAKGKGIDEKLFNLPEYGDNLRLLNPVASIACLADKFIYYFDDKAIEWPIEQNNDGIDIEDRVKLGIKKILEKIN